MNPLLNPRWLPWAMASLLTLGAALTLQVPAQEGRPLRLPLTAVVPAEFGSLQGKDVELSEDEREVAGVDDYLMRVYEGKEAYLGGAPWLSVYVGFYESQLSGQTIHSPKNCMPGAGWEALESEAIAITVAGLGEVQVNRYLLINEGQRVMVLYWYQGRGRVVASEYQAKWDLLRDASIKQRSDEALVRVVVPVVDRDDQADAIAREVAERLLPALNEALPAA